MQKFRVMSSRPLLTTAEYAELRNCSIRTIEGERSDGTGCPFIKIKGMVRYRAEDIEQFMAAGVRSSTKESAK